MLPWLQTKVENSRAGRKEELGSPRQRRVSAVCLSVPAVERWKVKHGIKHKVHRHRHSERIARKRERTTSSRKRPAIRSDSNASSSAFFSSAHTNTSLLNEPWKYKSDILHATDVTILVQTRSRRIRSLEMLHDDYCALEPLWILPCFCSYTTGPHPYRILRLLSVISEANHTFCPSLSS